MSTTRLGLTLSASDSPLTAPAAFIAWNWFYAYGVLASRNFKQWYGIDNQASPRQDLRKYGEIAVREGKMTQIQLDQIYRVEAASANSTEGFILFTASVLFGLVAGVPVSTVTKACTAYSVARIAYGFIYVFVADNKWAQARGIVWWCCNVSCLFLLYKGATQTV